MDYGSRLRKLRLAHGLSARKLAELTGISQPVISRLENNVRPTSDIVLLARICSALGLSLAEFFAPDGQEPELTSDLKQILDGARKLSSHQRKILLELIEEMKEYK
jgi:transcriptional regulator with XRE-family HTH domain